MSWNRARKMRAAIFTSREHVSEDDDATTRAIVDACLALDRDCRSIPARLVNILAHVNGNDRFTTRSTNPANKPLLICSQFCYDLLP